MRARRIHPSALCVALLAAAPFHAGAVRIDYVADAGIEHNDNVLMLPGDSEASTAIRTGFGFVVSEDTSTIQANFGGRFEYWKHVDGPQPSAFEGSLSGRLDWFMVPGTFSFTIEDSLETRPIDRFLPDTADNRQLVNVLALGPSLDFNWSRAFRGRLELRWIDSRAEENDDVESQRLSAALHASRELDPASLLTLSLRAQDVDFEHDLLARDHRRYDGYLAFDRRLNRMGFGLVAGYTRVEYDDGESRSHPLLRARAEWTISPRNSLALGAAHQLTDTSDSALGGITSVTTVPDRLSTASVTVNSSIYEEDRLELTWAYQHERTGLTLGPYYERVDFLDPGFVDETRRGAVLQLSYRIAPTWDLRTYADVSRSDFRGLGLRAEDSRFGLSLIKTWSRHWSWALDYMHYRRDEGELSGDSRQNIWYLSVIYRNR